MSGRSRPVLLAAGLVLLTAAWLMASSPFAGPDESSHYLRALSLANGHLLGPRGTYPDPELTPTEERYTNDDTRLVEVPRRLRPANTGCVDGRDRATCEVATPEGNFPPLPYLLPAAALKLSHTVATAGWLTRVASALPSVLFLVLAVVLLWSGTALSELGLMAALTPMVLFCASILNPSGPEITASIALAAAAIRLSRDAAQTPRWVLVAIGVAGVFSILSSPLGIVFGAAALLLGLLLLGPAGARALWRAQRRSVLVTGLVLLAAVVVSYVYLKTSGTPSVFGISPLGPNLELGLDQMGNVMYDSVGTFGALTVHLPLTVYRLAWVFEGLLIAAALVVGRGSDRAIVLLVTLVAFAFPVLFFAWVGRIIGIGLQGREVLPMLLLAPLAAGETILRSRRPAVHDDRARWPVAGALVLVGVFQGYAWWFNARANAGASGTLRFYAHAIWKPPLGWLPWIAVALLGVLALLTFGAAELAGARLRPRRAVAPQG